MLNVAPSHLRPLCRCYQHYRFPARNEIAFYEGMKNESASTSLGNQPALDTGPNFFRISVGSEPVATAERKQPCRMHAANGGRPRTQSTGIVRNAKLPCGFELWSSAGHCPPSAELRLECRVRSSASQQWHGHNAVAGWD
jgi:hypothetical protein